MDGLAEGVLLIDESDAIVYVNAAATRLLGLSREELIGVPYSKALIVLGDADGRALFDDELTRRLVDLCADPENSACFMLAGDKGESRHLSMRSLTCSCDSLPGIAMALSLEASNSPDKEIASKRRQKGQSAQAMDEQQAFLSRVIHRIPECMFLKDENARYVLLNQALAETYGLPIADMLAHNEQKINERLGRDAGDTARYIETDQQILSGAAQRVDFDHQFIDSGGQPRWFHTSKVGFHTEDGRRWVLGLSVDISERVGIEQDLLESRSFLQQVIDGSPGCIFIKDQQGRYLLVNRTMQAVYGNRTDSLVGKTDLELAEERPGYSSAEAQAFIDTDRIVFEGGGPQRFEERLTLPHGETRWFDTIKTLIDLEGRSGVLLGFAIDISERKQATLALRESEARYRLLQENAPIGIFTLDLRGRVTDINAMAMDILGLPSAQAVRGFNMLDFAPIVKTRMDQSIDRCLTEGETLVDEGTYVGPARRTVHIRYRLAPICPNEKAVEGVQAIIEDVTAVREMEVHLRQASKLGAIGQLAGGVAHSFNNLLTIINGYAEMSLSTLDQDHPLYGDLARIHLAGQRGAELTQQLLTLSRRQTGTPSLFNLNEVVASTAELMQRMLGEDITLVVDPAPETAMIRADQGQIEQVLMNLGANARDAMPGGGVLRLCIERLSLSTPLDVAYLPAKAGNYVRLSVEDSGIGMDAEVLDHLFEPFFTTKEEGRGTGLGLAMVYGVMQEIEGGISATSRPGHGSTFDLYFPAIAPDVKIIAESSATSPYALGGNETVIVIEDQNEVRRLVVRLLERLGYRVFAAGNAREATSLSLTLEERVDLLLVDVVMPDMSGPDLVQQLLGPCGEAKVLYMSGYADDVIRQKTGIDCSLPLLNKPFTLEKLAARVREALDSSRHPS